MHARTTQLRIRPGKFEEFKKRMATTIPLLRKQVGFRALVVLQTADKPKAEAMAISVWDSLADLKASEENMFLYQALARVMGACEGMPKISEHDVLLTEFAAD